jgi:hypothetical protein
VDRVNSVDSTVVAVDAVPIVLFVATDYVVVMHVVVSCYLAF